MRIHLKISGLFSSAFGKVRLRRLRWSIRQILFSGTGAGSSLISFDSSCHNLTLKFLPSCWFDSDDYSGWMSDCDVVMEENDGRPFSLCWTYSGTILCDSLRPDLIHLCSLFSVLPVGKTSLITRFMYDSFDNTYQVRPTDKKKNEYILLPDKCLPTVNDCTCCQLYYHFSFVQLCFIN